MSEIPQTRQSLLLELGKLSDDAWSEFLQIYENALYRYCLAKGLQEADANDVVQEVLAAAMERLPHWDPDKAKGSFRGWLFRVARNISVDTILQKSHADPTGGSRVTELLQHIAEQPDAVDGQFDEAYQRSMFEWASQLVKSEVKDVTWKSFYLTAIDGQKAEEVAAFLGVPIGNVYTAKCRVVSRIRKKIELMQQGLDG